jgi:integrase
MNTSTGSVTWTETKLQALQKQLQEFWERDEWNLSECPLANGKTGLRTLRFTCTSSSLNLELKYVYWKKIASGAWSMKAGSVAFIAVFVEWLNQVAPQEQSLLQRSLRQWEISLRSYLVAQGMLQEHVTTYLSGSQSPCQQRVADPRIPAFRQVYRTLQDAYDDRVEYDKDIWDIRKLGLSFNRSQSLYKLNFSLIEQPWLRQAAKSFLRYSLATAATASCFIRLIAIRKFSAFLSTFHPSIQPGGVTRSLMVEYIGYLTQGSLSVESRKEYLLLLRNFLDIAQREGWVQLAGQRLIYDEDIPLRRKRQPRFIPQEILDQLHQHMEALDPPILRMLLILEECGMRISELCTMPLSCLMQDAAGDWFLRYYQSKMKKEHSIPVSREVVAVIQEQQQAVREQLGTGVRYLFPSERGHPLKQVNFLNALNRLAYQKQICDGSGHLYRFQSHQFRHTLATRMINNGVPIQIIQRYLGHESLVMTQRYAEIYDQTLKEEFAKFRGKVVDVVGKVIEQEGSINSLDMQWFKKNILAQSLPNGYCALPVVAGTCPHANACLTCVHFRTDASFLRQHQAQLQETQQLIQVARQNGWQRQAEMNEKVVTNLEGIMRALESNHGT